MPHKNSKKKGYVLHATSKIHQKTKKQTPILLKIEKEYETK